MKAFKKIMKGIGRKPAPLAAGTEPDGHQGFMLAIAAELKDIEDATREHAEAFGDLAELGPQRIAEVVNYAKSLPLNASPERSAEALAEVRRRLATLKAIAEQVRPVAGMVRDLKRGR